MIKQSRPLTLFADLLWRQLTVVGADFFKYLYIILTAGFVVGKNHRHILKFWGAANGNRWQVGPIVTAFAHFPHVCVAIFWMLSKHLQVIRAGNTFCPECKWLSICVIPVINWSPAQSMCRGAFKTLQTNQTMNNLMYGKVYHMPLVLAKYHHSHSSFSLSGALVILYCCKMPTCLHNFYIYLFTRSLCLKIVMNPTMPPTLSFIGRQHAHILLQCVLFGVQPTPGQLVCGKRFYRSINLLWRNIQS